MEIENKKYLTTAQAAKSINVCQATMLALIKSHALRAINVSAGTEPRYHIAVDDLEAFIQSRTTGPEAISAS